jgi:hypothetical protein
MTTEAAFAVPQPLGALRRRTQCARSRQRVAAPLSDPKILNGEARRRD